MKIYQKSGDKNVGSNVVYAAHLGEDIPAFEFASGFEPGNGHLYSGNLEAYCKEMYESEESDPNPVY